MLPQLPRSGVIRCAQAGDLHVGSVNFGPLDHATGLRGRVLDDLACLDRAIDLAIERGCVAFFWPGDLFPNARPEPTLVRELVKRAARIVADGMALVIIPGNHDLAVAEGKASAVSLLGFLALPGVFVFEDIGLSSIPTSAGTLQILHIPWVMPQRILSAQEVGGLSADALADHMRSQVASAVRHALEEAASDSPVVAVAHASMPGARSGSEHAMWQGRGWELPEGLFDHPQIRYVALGHLHEHQQVGFRPPAVYSGSPDRVDFSEAGHTKGFVIFDVPALGDAAFEFLPLPARRYRTVSLNVIGEETPMTQIARELEALDLRDVVVRVEIACRPDQVPLIREDELRQMLSSAYAVSRISKHPLVETAAAAVTSGIGVESDPLDALTAYLVERGTPETQRAALVAHARELLVKLHERQGAITKEAA